ncbi:scavenger receptor cysteine-rich type 1 protein M130-like [Hemiscyllium ocellatum]|uniref:scavenger receptor cysteine-rich type 1 protein M130-like n=1 Tax=Hemiscyllium ocellatum TaxID=170820 RepID=UPI0029665E29|nr:scavenger receptor cysteine-rich type 1 protein M130-like [Hemiscyllium ocellatum]
MAFLLCHAFSNNQFFITDSQHNVTLVGGSSNCSGRVEIMCDEGWGALCGDSWDLTEANVVCRQLGCGFALSSQGGSAYSQAKGIIWQNDVKCKGSESSLSDCLSMEPTQKECDRKGIAHVICSGPDLLLSSRSSPLAGQARTSISIPGIICLALAVLLICDVIALLVVMQRKYQRKGRYTGGSSLGLYQGIYEEIADIPPVKKTSEKHGSVISASVGSVNRIEYYTSHGFGDNNLGSDDLEVNANRSLGVYVFTFSQFIFVLDSPSAV